MQWNKLVVENWRIEHDCRAMCAWRLHLKRPRTAPIRIDMLVIGYNVFLRYIVWCFVDGFRTNCSRGAQDVVMLSR